MRLSKHCLTFLNINFFNHCLNGVLFLCVLSLNVSCTEKGFEVSSSVNKESVLNQDSLPTQAPINQNSNGSASSNPNNSNSQNNSGSTSNSKTVKLTWNANKEKSVNSRGGGYKIYYSQIKDNELQNSLFVVVPYVSGSLAPTTAKISNLNKGKYYFVVQAYSALNSGSTSLASTEISLEVP
jgi:hypothetical protein